VLVSLVSQQEDSERDGGACERHPIAPCQGGMAMTKAIRCRHVRELRNRNGVFAA